MKQRDATREWPASADQLTLAQLSRLTAIDMGDLSRYRSGGRRMSAHTLERIEVVSRIDPDGYLAKRSIQTYSHVAIVIKRESDSDVTWVLRVLSRVMQTALSLESRADIRAFHARPPKTGSAPWDALLASCAEMTWQRLMPEDPEPTWMRTVRPVPAWWSPVDYGPRLSWAFARTPINLRSRGIVLPAGELETV